MYMKLMITLVIIYSYVVCCECAGTAEVEARGKKKKIAIFVYIADLILKKFFILKLVYAFIFWVLLHKAGYFLTWFAGYIKEQKHEHHFEHPHYEQQPSYGYGPYRRQNLG
ncbi:hypothetical protein ACJJTC_018559 [Scirpophaga incertulas]